MAFLKGKKKNTKAEEPKVEKTEEVLVEGIGSAEEDVQSTFNTDGLDILVAEGEVENVESTNED